jgi:hypothetical protein
MLSSVENDLAKAFRRWTEKKVRTAPVANRMQPNSKTFVKLRLDTWKLKKWGSLIPRVTAMSLDQHWPVWFGKVRTMWSEQPMSKSGFFFFWAMLTLAHNETTVSCDNFHAIGLIWPWHEHEMSCQQMACPPNHLQVTCLVPLFWRKHRHRPPNRIDMKLKESSIKWQHHFNTHPLKPYSSRVAFLLASGHALCQQRGFPSPHACLPLAKVTWMPVGTYN